MSEQMGYLDFEINISQVDGGYAVRVRALGGRAEARFTDPFTADRRLIIRQTLTTATLRHSAPPRPPSCVIPIAVHDWPTPRGSASSPSTRPRG